MQFGPQIPNLRSDLTSKAVWRPHWPQKYSKVIKNHQKIKFSISSMSATTLLGPNLVFYSAPNAMLVWAWFRLPIDIKVERMTDTPEQDSAVHVAFQKPPNHNAALKLSCHGLKRVWIVSFSPSRIKHHFIGLKWIMIRPNYDLMQWALETPNCYLLCPRRSY